MKKEHGLKDKDVDCLFKAVVDEGMDKADLTNAGSLVSSGMDVHQALRNAQEYLVFTVDIVAKHSDVARLISEHGLLNRQSLFKKIVYGEIPPLVKPSFVSTGIVIQKKKLDPDSLKQISKFSVMRKTLEMYQRAGKLNENQESALMSTKNILPENWTEEQCRQLKDIIAEVRSANPLK